VSLWRTQKLALLHLMTTTLIKSNILHYLFTLLFYYHRLAICTFVILFRTPSKVCKKPKTPKTNVCPFLVLFACNQSLFNNLIIKFKAHKFEKINNYLFHFRLHFPPPSPTFSAISPWSSSKQTVGIR